MTAQAPKLIRKLLIANRGEIAVRVIRTCKAMGIRTVAVYSEADQDSVFKALADEAYPIGPAPARESYLCVDKIIAAAKACGADAIHPGYGFLSEKAEFSAACAQAGLMFVGPKPDAIAAMGDKIEARRYAQDAGVPIVPGTKEPIADLAAVENVAQQFGYPILLKAAAGGGGKGMRVVRHKNELAASFSGAASEALKAFGDARVFVEKFIENPRHVEIQILCDSHGQGFFLGERECSTQRRHQKVVEEAPCVYLRQEVRQNMAAASLALAKAVGYEGVGTVEYLVDHEQNFYFLEMNTRLQVEHTVTEEIFGLDLVRLQIEVAQGQKLALKQNDLTPRGHAIQCRLYAEDPAQNFMPSPGQILVYEVPQGEGVRHDGGVVAGSEISLYYDPMMAKLIVWASTRAEAIQKMARALEDSRILGVAHNLEFLHAILTSAAFAQSQIHTQYLDQNLDSLTRTAPAQILPAHLAAAALSELKQTQIEAASAVSPWWQHGLSRQLRGRVL